MGSVFCIRERYKFYYINQSGKKLLCKTKEEISKYSVSGKGLEVYYAVENKIYKYSLKDKEIKKIFEIEKNDDYTNCTVRHIESSENGKYCFFEWMLHNDIMTKYEHYSAIYNDEDENTVTEKGSFDYRNFTFTNNGNAVMSSKHSFQVRTDENEDVIKDYTCLTSFDYSTGVSKSFAEIEGFDYEIEYFNDNMYIMYDSQKLYSGKIGSEPKLVYSGELTYFIDCGGKDNAAFFSDGKYIFRIDLNSGKRLNIVKDYQEKDPDAVSGTRIYDFFTYSSDFKKIIYIDYDRDKLVSLSNWNEQKNAYISKNEITLNGNGYEYLWDDTYDLSMVFVVYDDDDPYYYHKVLPLSFKGDNLTQFELIRLDKVYNLRCDKFGHIFIFCDSFDKDTGIYLLNLNDGSRELIFDNNAYDFANYYGFIIFRVGKDYYDYGYIPKIEDIYYIDENGKPVIYEENVKNEYVIVF